MRVLVTGATGTAGSAALRQALADPRVDAVTAVARRPVGVEHPKLTTLLVEDFLDWSPRSAQLAGHDAALWCLGTSQFRVTREELHRITVDFTLAGADALRRASPGLRFCHLSGSGADPTGRSRIAFAQEKGEAERRLDALVDEGPLWHFRPAYIHPAAPPREPLLQDRIMGALAPALRRVAPSTIIDADDLARAMLHVAHEGAPARVLDHNTIRGLAGLR